MVGNSQVYHKNLVVILPTYAAKRWSILHFITSGCVRILPMWFLRSPPPKNETKKGCLGLKFHGSPLSPKQTSSSYRGRDFHIPWVLIRAAVRREDLTIYEGLDVATTTLGWGLRIASISLFWMTCHLTYLDVLFKESWGIFFPWFHQWWGGYINSLSKLSMMTLRNQQKSNRFGDVPQHLTPPCFSQL